MDCSMSRHETTPERKNVMRKNMRLKRRVLNTQNPSPDLHLFFKDILQMTSKFSTLAGFTPIKDEINIWPLLTLLHQNGQRIALPVVINAGKPLIFREWTPGCDMETDRYGVSFPKRGETLTPQIVLVPLLAFTARGERLGYGGGYYDRTLAALRNTGEVFACGVAYAGQEVEHLPTDAHDAKLDGVLTETGFRTFT